MKEEEEEEEEVIGFHPMSGSVFIKFDCQCPDV